MEIDGVLESLANQCFSDKFEVLIIEDGSSEKCEHIVKKHSSKLELKYFFKESSGAGLSRNYGMQQAIGNYFIILDSDVIVPKNYLKEVKNALEIKYTDAFGGPDAVDKNSTFLQKAINYSMTSVLTTGGIRGKNNVIGKFQPRSFNFGLSKKAFQKTKGFSNMKYGEDIELTFRLWEQNFKSQLIEKAFVYHKRKNTITKFYKQTYNFGFARNILNSKFPKSSKLAYLLPSLFIIGFDVSIVFAIFGYYYFISVYILYFALVFIDSLVKNTNIFIAFFSVITTYVQFLGYGLGFLKSKFSF